MHRADNKARMNEEPTQNLSGTRSFEERVFARFDAFDARFDSVDARFTTVDARFDAVDARFDAVDARFEAVDARFDTVDARLEKLESRAYDTKPIWERALAAIMELGLEMGEVKNEVGEVKQKVTGIENRVAVIEGDVASIKTDYADMKRDLKHQVNRRIDLILNFLLEERDDIRDAEDRIKQLESKLA
jgi:chromosome segregation ATPase